MFNRIFSAISTWPFIISLFLLLLNDWWLKSHYPGDITGKLSDFAGIAVVALILLSSWPHRRRTIYFALAALFLWWKSPISEPFITFINSVFPFRISRTVDYTDLLALFILPLCNQVISNLSRYSLPKSQLQKVLLTPLVATTIFAIMGTSHRPVIQESAVRHITAADEIQIEEIVKVIDSIAIKHGLKCEIRPDQSEKRKYTGNGIIMTYTIHSHESVVFNIMASGKTGSEHANALSHSLKTELAKHFSGLEYVEQLNFEVRLQQGNK